ncbi:MULTISPECIES: DUF3606 domain-containing protein [unclassified Variovorax]|uniref:DUF3606 domain-containing protein n=1 Tax=unclassified Variovorax TaxID=663243 RepID=UPI0008D63B15|nr:MULTISPECIES: DUF3606 domain-containing protein [unclassified Variovorax]SEK17324.1 Protein of unknown function [Variovorax sp. OK202]SFE79477.1 Protein of unknown function [Variovorax sp. OK212]
MAHPSDATPPRIDKNDSAQVARWTRELDVAHEQLAHAIAEVGDKAADVELYLKGSRSSTNADTADTAAKAI